MRMVDVVSIGGPKLTWARTSGCILCKVNGGNIEQQNCVRSPCGQHVVDFTRP